MASFSNIRDVQSLGETPAAYRCVLDLGLDGEVIVGAPFVARAGGGGFCDAVLSAIEAGHFAGIIAPYVEPPAPAPHETPLSPAQWDFALRANGLRGPLMAALDALEGTDPVRSAHLASRVFSRERYVYGDVIALLAANQDVLPAGIADLTEAEVQAMWAATLAAVPA